MYVLSSDRAELHYFPSPEDIDEGYAILSHVWEKKGEQTFEEVQTIAKKCNEDGTNPRDFVSDKIRQCCILAEKHGYRWIWNDTCCIDKRSSSELSEAINSMFQYYSLAEVCYAYLRDVLSDDIAGGDDFMSLRHSRWHKRGWTLQELIAPEFLIFVSKDWQPLSSRRELADVLEDITKIPAPLLRLETKVSDYSVAQRMSWAAWRETTREEDIAYSLIGLFGIHMPTLYGEGTNAFRRLQEEIMRQSVDPSIFLWGVVTALDPKMVETAVSGAWHHQEYYHQRSLLAPSPFFFSSCSDIVFLQAHPVGVVETQIKEPYSAEGQTATSRSTVTFGDSVDLPSFTLTSFGIHAHLPVVQQGSEGVLLAILPCFQRPKGEHLGLLLTPYTTLSSHSRAFYHVFNSFSGGRVVAFDDVQLASVEWTEVFIPSPLPNVPGTVSPTPLINTMLSPPFRIPRRSVRELSRIGDYAMDPEPSTLATWTRTPHIATIFRRHGRDQCMAILLGRCQSHIEDTGDQDLGRLGPHWAAITFNTSEDQRLGLKPKGYEHACPGDHVGPNSKICVEDHHRKADPWEPPETTKYWVFSFTRRLLGIGPDSTILVVNAHHLSITTAATLCALGIRPFRPRVPPGITPLTHLKSMYAWAKNSREGSVWGPWLVDDFLYSDVD